jgi:hypothetical protein
MLRLYKDSSSTNHGLPIALGAFSSYDTAPAPVFKGLPSLLVMSPVQRSAYDRRDPRFDFCRHDPRFCWTLLREGLDCLHFTESPGNSHSRPCTLSPRKRTHLRCAPPGPSRAHCTLTAHGHSRTCVNCPLELSRLQPEYSVPK